MEGGDRHIAAIVQVDIELMPSRTNVRVVGSCNVIFAPVTGPNIEGLKRRGTQKLTDLFYHLRNVLELRFT